MENREDLKSILPFLPVVLQGSSLIWPPKALEALKALSRGPSFSGVDSGAVFFDAIIDLRDSICVLSRESLAPSARRGYTIFFDQLMSVDERGIWFEKFIPLLASLLMRVPSLLEDHYRIADIFTSEGKHGLRVKTGLQLLYSQKAGIVLLSQELISALLACSLFCLFPVQCRYDEDLPDINFDHLFASLHPRVKQSQESKIKCIVHYFKRICSCIPSGFVSFERKVLPLKPNPFSTCCPVADFWSTSAAPLCSFEISHSGFIEDQPYEALEVDFANKYIGGGALGMGCVQEEIRFMINPELIISMLFLPSMGNNEAIEIVGAERFSCYTGYASSFLFTGDYLDKRLLDSIGRRKTSIVAIDALCNPGLTQYEVRGLLRETNKAFCGFSWPGKIYQESAFPKDQNGGSRTSTGKEIDELMLSQSSDEKIEIHGCSVSSEAVNGKEDNEKVFLTSSCISGQGLESQKNIGVATGNWGCGAFGGDPEIKSVIQWLAASQVGRPFILYYTLGGTTLQRLEEVKGWIMSHEWTVGDLWNIMLEYCSQRLNGLAFVTFFNWLLPLPTDYSGSIKDPCPESR